jgi:nucleoside-diphosphate-sugar epimerase
VRRPIVLVTGANGEVGHGLIQGLAAAGHEDIVAVDLQPLDPELAPLCRQSFAGSILDRHLMERIVSEYEVSEIYHLAALLSTRAEFTPETAHEVNVEGTLRLLTMAREQTSWRGKPVKFLFPSSIAVYGLPDLATKERAGKVKEYEWTAPTTVYGCNKLYCEQLGRYFSERYRQLAADADGLRLDFRCLRFPGIISAATMPSGGTSDFAPEMIHAAARGEPYACFVREDTIIPFMVMPDAIKALLGLAAADPGRLRRRIYNVTSFSLTAGEIRDRVLRAFPEADVSFQPHQQRQGIVDTWPLDVDDGPARRDWGWEPGYDVERSFTEYLVPEIREHYAAGRAG